MNTLTVKIGTEEIGDIVKNPSLYPEELVAVTLDVVTGISRQVREAKTRLEGNLIMRMEDENATKIMVIGLDGIRKMLTLKNGSFKCKDKDADVVYQNSGFDPQEIGEYVFKGSWSKAKEMRKFGGDKQLVIDELFKRDDPRIEIKDLK